MSTDKALSFHAEKQFRALNKKEGERLVQLGVFAHSELCCRAFGTMVFRDAVAREAFKPAPPREMTWEDLDVPATFTMPSTGRFTYSPSTAGAVDSMNITLLIARALESHGHLTLMVDRVKVGEIAIENGRVVTRS